MSQAEDLLNSLIADSEVEEHIIIGKDRFIQVPQNLKKIAVQYDHNVRTVTFDCPRYSDGRDLSTMIISVNYLRPDGEPGLYTVKEIRIDETDETLMHFDWVIEDDVTAVNGTLSFLICAKKTNSDGINENHWNTELNQEMTISKGLNCTEQIINRYPDLIAQILLRLDEVEKNQGSGSGSDSGSGSGLDATGAAINQVPTADGEGNWSWKGIEFPEQITDTHINELIDAKLGEATLNVETDKTLTQEGKAADSKITGEKITELKGDLNNYAKSAFRYIPTTENNKFCRWDTGKIQSSEGKSVCSRIPVTELENVEIYSNNNVYSICFFNDETFISGSGGSSPRPKSFSIPANCNNVIISFDGLDTNIVLVYRSKIDDYIVNNQVLPTYEFSVKTMGKFMRWDNGKIFVTTDYMMSQPFIVESGKEYYVTGAITIAACFLNGSTFVSGTALNGVDHFTIPEGCNRCVVDFEFISDLPTIMVRDPLLRNTSLCYGKVLGCLGDSITQGAGNNNHSWVDKMQSMCGFKSVYNYGVSGDTIEKMHDRIDAMESTLDYITLFGGTNNALWSNSQSIADFKASFDSLVSSIIEKYPTSKVLGIIPPKYNYSSGDVTRNWNVPTSPNNLKLIDFVNAEIEIYSKYSVPIVNLFSCCNIQPDINAQKIGLMPDGVHPNQKGYFDFIAPKIAEALKSI